MHATSPSVSVERRNADRRLVERIRALDPSLLDCGPGCQHFERHVPADDLYVYSDTGTITFGRLVFGVFAALILFLAVLLLGAAGAIDYVVPPPTTTTTLAVRLQSASIPVPTTIAPTPPASSPLPALRSAGMAHASGVSTLAAATLGPSPTTTAPPDPPVVISHAACYVEVEQGSGADATVGGFSTTCADAATYVPPDGATVIVTPYVDTATTDAGTLGR